MAGYSGSRAAFTPSATQNWVLFADGTGEYGKITKVTWGGEMSSSTPARTRWTRPTTPAGSSFTPLDGSTQGGEPNHPSNTPRCQLGTYATAPTLGAAPRGLFGISWNKNGGGGIFSATQPDEEWIVVAGITPGSQIACAQDVETSATSMSVSAHWKED